MRQPKIALPLHLLTLSLLMLVLMAVDISVGDSSLSSERVWEVLLGRAPEDTVAHQIVWSIRFVRIGVSILIGAALVLCGLMMQTIFQNPLADPYILGVSSGSSLGVALFVLGAPLLGLTGAAWVREIGMLGAAWAGSALVLLFITLLD